MVYFVGAGSGAVDLITVRGKNLLEQADVIIYAGSLVNPELLDYKKEGCMVYNSAKMTLEDVLEVMEKAEAEGKMTVRLHTGDPCIYGAIREQMDRLDEKGIDYESCPGVSAFCGAASALNLEYTLPGVSQSAIITRMAGRTPVPERESIASFAAHQATDGCFFEYRIAGRTFQGVDCRRLYGRDTGSDCIQGNLEGRRKIYLHGGNTGADREGAQHYENGADDHWRGSYPQ